MPPNKINELLRTAIAHHQAGRTSEAESIYRQVLATESKQADALHLLGVLRGQAGFPREAVDLIRRAIAAAGGGMAQAGWWSNLGKFLLQAEDAEGAVEACLQAVEMRGDLVEGHVNLGNAYRARGELAAAVSEYRYALRLKPDLPGGQQLLGMALLALGDEENLREAVKLMPGVAAAWNNLGNVMQRSGRLDEALEYYREALRIEPALAEGHNNLGSVFKEMGQVDDAVGEYRRAVELAPENAGLHSNLLLALNYHVSSTREGLYREALEWARRHADGLARVTRRPAEHDQAERRLRIGYVSADFRSHASAFFLAPLLENHDAAKVEVFCYSDVSSSDSVTDRLRRAAHHWRHIAGMSHQSVTEMVRDDAIDVLVDLKLHADHNRLLVFARKPAPVQVTWLGYPGTTGMKAMDFRLTDPWLDPDPEQDDLYAEKTVRLPETFWCYDPMSNEMVSPALSTGGVTFGCLNHFSKMNQELFSIWAQLLKRVEGSRLLLLAAEGSHRDQAAKAFEQLGVQPQRIVFVGPRPREDYLRLYQGIDIALDSWAVNGHTTTFDALWMGVPVVTMAGPTALGRAGISQLMNLGMKEMIAASAQEYIDIAATLAGDLGRVSEIRAGLRARMQQSALMDGRKFARNMEEAFKKMLKHVAAAPPT